VAYLSRLIDTLFWVRLENIKHSGCVSDYVRFLAWSKNQKYPVVSYSILKKKAYPYASDQNSANDARNDLAYDFCLKYGKTDETAEAIVATTSSEDMKDLAVVISAAYSQAIKKDGSIFDEDPSTKESFICIGNLAYALGHRMIREGFAKASYDMFHMASCGCHANSSRTEECKNLHQLIMDPSLAKQFASISEQQLTHGLIALTEILENQNRFYQDRDGVNKDTGIDVSCLLAIPEK